jgi:hypothetical protein
VKLIPGVNSINALHEAFPHTDPESAKKTDNLTVFFALSGSVGEIDPWSLPSASSATPLQSKPL